MPIHYIRLKSSLPVPGHCIYCLTDAPKALAVTLVSHPVPPLTQLNALNIQMVSLALDTLWRHVGRLYGTLSLEEKLIEQWERSLVSALPL